MKTLFVALALFIPATAYCQTYSEMMREILAEKKSFYAPDPSPLLPSQVVPVVPVVPAYPRNVIPPNPYGTGYSVVTTQRTQPDYVQQYMGNRDATMNTTVTSVVPNNAWGAPIRPIVPFWP